MTEIFYQLVLLEAEPPSRSEVDSEALPCGRVGALKGSRKSLAANSG